MAIVVPCQDILMRLNINNSVLIDCRNCLGTTSSGSEVCGSVSKVVYYWRIRVLLKSVQEFCEEGKN